MKSFAVIGHPIGHSLSPALYNYLFSLLSLDARYRAVDIPSDGLDSVAEQLRQGELNGINITMPHKTAFLACLDHTADDAVIAGAVNCVAAEGGRLVGYNTDVAGVQYALKQGGVGRELSSALILGAGGAARAAVTALLHAGTERICVAARRMEAVEGLLKDFQNNASSATLEGQALGPGLDCSPCHLVINATPVGMWPHEDTSPLHSDQLHAGQTVLDLVYRPEKTMLLRMAEERGCRVIPGLEMFIGQGLASLERWFPGAVYQDGGSPNPLIDVPALKAVLVSAMQSSAAGSNTQQEGGPV